MGMTRKFQVPDQTAKADLVDGKIPIGQLPSIALTEFIGAVANQAALLALTPDSEGDWTVKTDSNQLCFFTGGDPSQIGNWLLVSLASAVTSVAGRTGIVVLTKTDVGLSNVSDTSDANKPVSSQQQDALNTLQATLTGMLPGSATTSATGLVKKGAAISSSAGNEVSSTVSGLSVGYVAGVAVPADLTAFVGATKSDIAALTTLANATRARLEELISKLQTAGVQT